MKNGAAKLRDLKQWAAGKEKYSEAAGATGSALFLLLAWIAGYAAEGWAIPLYVASYVCGGALKLKDGIITLVKERDLDVNLLMIAAAAGAASIGYWAEGAVLIFIFALSGALETFTINRSSRDISALMELKPEDALRIVNGIEERVLVEQLQVGDIVLVKPAERIPVDGVIEQGGSAVNQASITGESVPVDKSVGDDVFAGTMNGQGVLYVSVAKSSESTMFAKIVRLVQEAQSETPKSQRVVEKFERIYARAIILFTVLLVMVSLYVLGQSWEESFYRAMVFLVVASPCALVASIMPATLSAISNSARKGVLFKGGAHLEHLSRVKVVAFDKTGTLTQGTPDVTDVAVYQGYSAEQVMQAAAVLESLSTHPIARAIVQHCESQVEASYVPRDAVLNVRRQVESSHTEPRHTESSYMMPLHTESSYMMPPHTEPPQTGSSYMEPPHAKSSHTVRNDVERARVASYTGEQVVDRPSELYATGCDARMQAQGCDAASHRKLLSHISDFQALTGMGVEARLDGVQWRVGKPKYIMNLACIHNTAVQDDIRRLEQQGKTVVLVQRNDEVVGLIALQDRIRRQAKALIQQLKRLGIQAAMLTGDQQQTAHAIAEEAGIELVYAELMPEDKLRIVKQLKQQYGAVAMVGDGVNDAPALAAATVGIAMGAAGSDAALETADLVLMNDDLDRIKDAILLGRRTHAIVKQNIIFASIIILSLIGTNFLFGIPLPLGVVGHEGSTILVILNGLRLLK
ncbi:heavy metal translocating P-type ATPase [Paenibacillus sp. 481]|uniref:heavy metal translocating P-type ATPase n=1 Tax=Paenibacillus sp. 481 TaxID=2835869 RepID=UPI001E2C82D7|nr:heavy metal translocating P-type ATPase [Paenibacillus sp. 481]